MRYPVQTRINGYVTFLIEADSQALANERMKYVSQVEFGADFCDDGSGGSIHIDEVESSDLEIQLADI